MLNKQRTFLRNFCEQASAACSAERITWLASAYVIHQGHYLCVSEIEMVLDVYTKKRILFYENLGLKPLSIVRELKRDIQCRRISREGVRLFLKQYKETGSIARKPGSGRPTKITAQAKRLVDDRLREDDEMTATQLHALLRSAGLDVSFATISRCREKLGWTFRSLVPRPSAK